MKKLFVIGLAVFISSPALAEDDQATTIAKMQAQLNGLAEQNRALNGRVEDLQHQLVQPAAPQPYGIAVPPSQQPVAVAPSYAAQPMTQYTTPQVPVAQYPAPQVAIPADSGAVAFPRADATQPIQAIPYTPPLQGQAVISPRLDQPVAVVGADGSMISKPNQYVTKVAPPLPPLPTNEAPEENTLEDEFDQIFQTVSNEDYAKAKPQLKGFIEKHPGTDLAGEAYFWLGEIAYSEKNYNEAAINYLKGYKESPKADKAPENILKLSLVLKQLGKNPEACKYIARFNTEFPDAHPDLKARAASARTDIGCK